jgi:ATP-dependent exoDNAse (exonuclease V) alpha subunit
LLNLCFTNEKRKQINKNACDAFMKSNNKASILIEKLPYDDNSQEYYLKVGMPLIARKNHKSLGIVNNDMVVCSSIKKDSVLVVNNLGENIEVPKHKIKFLFHLGFCITIHKSQGATFTDKYTINEWEKLDKRLKYVALSRATDENNIYINDN